MFLVPRDADLDAFLGSDKQGRIWLNDGRGRFTDSGQRLDISSQHAIILGDVDGNGTTDVVAGKLDNALVWLNDGLSQMYKYALCARRPSYHLDLVPHEGILSQ